MSNTSSDEELGRALLIFVIFPFASNFGCAKYATCQSSQKTSVKYKPYTPCFYPDHDLKNIALGRPMSPHLTIYGPTWTGVMSIGQRVSGAVLTGYAALLCIGALFLPDSIDTYVDFIQSLEIPSYAAFVLKVLVAFPYSFHMINGIRFCMWNLGKWLEVTEVYTTGKIAVLSSVILSIMYGFL